MSITKQSLLICIFLLYLCSHSHKYYWERYDSIPSSPNNGLNSRHQERWQPVEKITWQACVDGLWNEDCKMTKVTVSRGSCREPWSSMSQLRSAHRRLKSVKYLERRNYKDLYFIAFHGIVSNLFRCSNLFFLNFFSWKINL